MGCRRVEWKEGWKLSRRLSVDITVESARHGTEQERETGKRYGEAGTRGKWEESGREEDREGMTGASETRKRRGIRDFVCSCLSVRLNLGAHQQPPTSKKNLAERRIPSRRNDGGAGRG